MNITIISACSYQYRHMRELAYSNKLRYAQRHEYRFIMDSFDANQYSDVTGKHPSWFKIISILTRIELCDWIWWSDVDSIFANPSIRIEDIIDDRYDIIAGRFPLNSLSSYTIHTGNFLIKCSSFSRQLLTRIYHDKTYAHFNTSAMREEDALIFCTRSDNGVQSQIALNDLSRFSSWVPMKGVEWNHDWTEYQPGDFIIHFPSPATLSTRTDYMRQYCILTRNMWQ